MDIYLAEIRMFGGNFAPRDWSLCNGQLLAISSNQALFSLLGTTFGGDGRTTFALPDMRGRVAIHAGHGPGLTDRTLGQRSGQETVVLNSQQIPSHSHAAAVTGGGFATGTGKGDSGNPAGNYIDESAIATDLFKSSGGGAVMLGGQGVTVTNSNTGNNLSHNNMAAYAVVNYIICIAGLFPSRN